MAPTGFLTTFPRTLRASTTQPDAIYRRVPALIAIHGAIAVPRGLETVLTFEEPPILVCRYAGRAIPRALAGATITPVYALEPRGAPAVPTGLVLVRFAQGIVAADAGERLAREGFTLVEPLPYAPHAVWVRAAVGGIPASLSGIPALEAIANVVNVEPQLLRPPGRR